MSDAVINMSVDVAPTKIKCTHVKAGAPPVAFLCLATARVAYELAACLQCFASSIKGVAGMSGVDNREMAIAFETGQHKTGAAS